MDELYSLAAKVSLDVTAFSGAARLAMGLFQKMEGAASKSERAMQVALGSRATAYAAAERAANSLSSAQVRYTQAEAAYNKAMGSSNSTIAQQIAAQDRLTIAHNSLANAQIGQATAANRAANAMATYNVAAAESVGLAERQAALSRGMGLLTAGAAITGVGVGLFALMDSAVKKAMSLQTIVLGIQQRTGVTLIDPATQGFTAKGNSLLSLFTNIGLTNQMSKGEVAGIAQAASQAGITGMSMLKAMLKPLANYSEVMLRATGASTSGSAKVATEFAHLFGAFGMKKIGGVSDTQYMVNQLGKAMQVVPVSQDEFLHLVSQYAGTVRPMYRGKPPGQFISDTIDYGVLMAQMGQQTRGGSQLARLLVQAMGAGSRTSKIGLADLATIQRVSGVSFTNKQGQITDPVSLMKALTGFATHRGVTPQTELIYFQQAFKQAGTALAGLFADPVVAQRFKQIAATMKAMPDLAAQQKAYNASPAGQFNQAHKNFDSAMTALGVLWLPIATMAANALVGFTRGLVQVTQQHPKIMQFLALFVALSAVVALVLGPLVMLASIFALLELVTLPALVAAMLPVILIFAGLVAAIALVTLAILHWKDIFGPDNGSTVPGPGGSAFQKAPPGMTPPHAGDKYLNGFWYRYHPPQGRVPGQWAVDPVPTPSGRRNVHGRAVGGGGYVPPGATVHVQGGVHFTVVAQPHHDEEQIGVAVMRRFGDWLQGSIGQGDTTAMGLYPSLQVAR